MSAMKAMLADPRRRNLVALTAVAAASVVMAVWGLERQAAEVAPKYVETEFLPGFAAHVREAARIHIQSKKNGAFDVVFKPNKGWVLPGKNDYPASFEEVNKTLVALAALETIEPKTARADWLHYIDLDDPARGGAGTRIVVSDDHGRALASLIVGKSEDIGDTGGATGLFVRRIGENQSWLVRAAFEPQSEQNDWVEKRVIDLDRAQIQSTTVDEPNGQFFEVSRDKPSDASFKLAVVPAGREEAAGAADGLATAIVDFAFDDVKPARNFNFTDATRLVTKTFDGLNVTVDVLHLGSDYWAQIAAMGAAGNRDAGRRAREINARAAGWAFKLPDYKGAQFMTPLENLLKPKPGKKAAAETP